MPVRKDRFKLAATRDSVSSTFTPLRLTLPIIFALFQRIAKGIEAENKFSRSIDIIDFAMKEAWLAGFEDGRKHRGAGRIARTAACASNPIGTIPATTPSGYDIRMFSLFVAVTSIAALIHLTFCFYRSLTSRTV